MRDEDERPMLFRWSSAMGTMEVLKHSLADARAMFHDGVVYRMTPYEERTKKEHNHFFACVHKAWLNLREGADDSEFRNSEHLRKFALIKTGYYRKKSIVCSTAREAAYFAGFLELYSIYAIIEVSGAVIDVYTPESQSEKEMGRDRFQQSKRDVLEYLADKIGVTYEELTRVPKKGGK